MTFTKKLLILRSAFDIRVKARQVSIAKQYGPLAQLGERRPEIAKTWSNFSLEREAMDAELEPITMDGF